MLYILVSLFRNDAHERSASLVPFLEQQSNPMKNGNTHKMPIRIQLLELFTLSSIEYADMVIILVPSCPFRKNLVLTMERIRSKFKKAKYIIQYDKNHGYLFWILHVISWYRSCWLWHETKICRHGTSGRVYGKFSRCSNLPCVCRTHADKNYVPTSG